jgi:hypothetical protein
MKHLLSAIAMAALIGAMPAMAQTSSTEQSKHPSAMGTSSDNSAAQSGTTSPGNARHGGKEAAARRGGSSPEDNMAEELNRQELERVQGNSAQTTGAGAATTGSSMQSGATTGSSDLNASGAPRGGRPARTGSRAGSAEVGSPSPEQREEHPGEGGQE